MTLSEGRDPNRWLLQLAGSLVRLTSGRSGSPQRTRLARIAVLALGLVCVVPRMLDALGAGVWVLIGLVGLVVTIRQIVGRLRRW